MRGDENIEEIISRHLPSADQSEMELDGDRVWNRLRARAEQAAMPHTGKTSSSSSFGWRFAGVAATAAMLVAAVGVVLLDRPGSALATVESVDGSLYRSVGNAPEMLRTGSRLRTGDTVLADKGLGSTLVLADGSRVEMRSKSELTLEEASDGVRLRLSTGGLIINAAKQPAGKHLYVQTKDMTVSVVGTVFLVNAEEEGSRAAVIEGEIRVQHGATEKNLLSGEQVATNPTMPTLPVTKEVSWSRNAQAHIALLMQSALPAPAPTRETFELASIRPTSLSHGGERGAGGGAGKRSLRPGDEPCGDAGNFFLRFDPGRVDITDMTVYGLIAWAYGIECRPFLGSDFLLGGPKWIKDDGYDIQALIPPGPPAYTERELSAGAGRTMKGWTMTPRFQKLLQTLLAERFQLVLGKETKEMPVYILTAPKGGGKLVAWKEGDLPCLGPGPDCRRYGARGASPESIQGQKQSIASLAEQLQSLTGRIVLDRTGITGEYNYSISFAWFEGPTTPPRPTVDQPREPGLPPRSDVSLFSALEQALGLKLEAAKMPVDVTIIERVERPSEN